MASIRRLAAILVADVTGYPRLIGADEGGTLERLRALRRELLDRKIAEHHGRLVKTTIVCLMSIKLSIMRGGETSGSNPAFSSGESIANLFEPEDVG